MASSDTLHDPPPPPFPRPLFPGGSHLQVAAGGRTPCTPCQSQQLLPACGPLLHHGSGGTHRACCSRTQSAGICKRTHTQSCGSTTTLLQHMLLFVISAHIGLVAARPNQLAPANAHTHTLMWELNDIVITDAILCKNGTCCRKTQSVASAHTLM